MSAAKKLKKESVETEETVVDPSGILNVDVIKNLSTAEELIEPIKKYGEFLEIKTTKEFHQKVKYEDIDQIHTALIALRSSFNHVPHSCQQNVLKNNFSKIKPIKVETEEEFFI